LNAAPRVASWLPGRLLVWAAVLSLAGCISGRVLEGWPGYPFLSFETPAPVDSLFFAVQRELVAEGFDLDFTERASGLVNTRPLEIDAMTMFVSVVVDTTATGGSRVWVAGYEPVRGGARRLSPRREEAWATLRGIAVRLSERLGGTRPTEPEPPAG
jgi:hypothetical protein